MKDPELFRLLKSVPDLIDKTFPVPARFRSRLPKDIAELSRLLTSSRGERSLSYLNRPNLLSAYLHYFLPWNLYRLCLLLPSLDISLSANDSIIDLGSGTLTFVSALWISRPDLHKTPLEFFCVDRSGQALEAGKKFFTALTGENPWKIRLIREEIILPRSTRRHTEDKKELKIKTPCNSKLSEGQQSSVVNKKFSFICAVNLFNEIYERIPHNNTAQLKKFSESAAEFLHKHAAENACILTVEPGVPQSGRFISFLRSALLELGHAPAAPCTHSAACPLTESAGGLNRVKKWCHFAHENFEPPKELVRLSAAAKLPKERLVYGYLFAGSDCKERPDRLQASGQAIRVISDLFPISGPSHKRVVGRYGCCEQGLVLLAGEKNRMEKLASGSVVFDYINTNRIDEKSGAVIIEIK